MEVSSVASEKRSGAWNRSCVAVFATVMGTVVLGLWQCATIHAQVVPGRQQISGDPKQPAQESGSGLAAQTEAESELQTGTALTRKGSFHEAIPHLMAARGRVANEYAANFNLALCYVATRQAGPAIEVLSDLRRTGHDGVDVENLLAQAYVGNGQPQEALASVEKAASLSPSNEKLYLFVADACRAERKTMSILDMDEDDDLRSRLAQYSARSRGKYFDANATTHATCDLMFHQKQE